MHAGHVVTHGVGGFDFGHDVLQRERRGVNHARSGRCGLHDLLRHQRTCIEADWTGLDELQAAHRDEVGCAGAGADEMNGHSANSLFLA